MLQPVALTAGAPEALLTLSERGELTVAAVQTKAQAATGGEELSSQAVSELPLNKRDFSSLLLLAAGTMTDYEWRHQLYRAVCHQRTARSRSDLCHGRRGHQRSRDGRRNVLELQRGCRGRNRLEFGSGCRPRSGAAPRASPTFIRAPGPAVFTDRFSSSCATRPLMRATISIIATPAYPGRIPPFRRNEFGFTNGGPVYIPHVYDGRKRTFYFTPVPGISPGAGHHAGDAGARRQRNVRSREATMSTT